MVVGGEEEQEEEDEQEEQQVEEEGEQEAIAGTSRRYLSIEVPVTVNAYGHCFPGSAYSTLANDVSQESHCITI